MEVIKKDGEKAIACVKGRLDALSAPEFEKALLELIDNGEHTIILDFSELDYISSAGLRSILVVAKRMEVEKGELSVATLKEEVKQVFDLSGFSSFVPVFDTVAAATNSA